MPHHLEQYRALVDRYLAMIWSGERWWEDTRRELLVQEMDRLWPPREDRLYRDRLTPAECDAAVDYMEKRYLDRLNKARA